VVVVTTTFALAGGTGVSTHHPVTALAMIHRDLGVRFGITRLHKQDLSHPCCVELAHHPVVPRGPTPPWFSEPLRGTLR
jgi:hypothetical protein